MKSLLTALLVAIPIIARADFPVAPDPLVPSRLVLETATLPEGDIALPTPFANVTAAFSDRARFELLFNADATTITLLMPENASRPERILLDTGENSTPSPDGTIVFCARDAEIVGATAKLESHPGNHRIGFWSDAKDSLRWPYQPTRYGRYDAELTYALAEGTSEIAIKIGGASLKAKLDATGSWYRYRTVALGELYLPEARTALEVLPIAKSGAAVMNFKALTLRPAPEGAPVVQSGDEPITLDSSQATVHGVTMRYEPKPEKSCLGYWTNPSDFASWDFTVATPGSYRVEITQGCGGGNGGSEVEVRCGEQSLTFTVEDTGGFQNWKAREIGQIEIAKAGPHRLELRPRNKTGAAVMDIRRVRLVHP